MDFSWRVGGEAGYGIDTAGMLFSRICLRHGLNVCGNREYPSLIRGGHNNFSVRFSDKELTTHVGRVNLLAALNERTITEEVSDVLKDGVIIHDNNIVPKVKGYRLIGVPLDETAGKHGDAKLMMNIVIIGASAGLIGFSKDTCIEVISEFFARKGEQIVKGNVAAFSDAFDLMSKEKKLIVIPKADKLSKMLITGNTAFSIGALRAGCNFISAYPMTPASTIMEYMFTKAQECGVRALQSEDEISAINSAIGAAYAGARALTCTSGGGFALMTEGVSLAGMSETPVVIALSQRPGPATGLPTRTEQGDLMFALYGGHGEFTRIILAPGDVNECYEDAINSFNYAEMFQTPVIVLLDKHLSEGIYCANEFKDYSYKIVRGSLINRSDNVLQPGHKFKRYELAKDGVSPRPVPGVKGLISCSIGDEHDEEGFIIESGEQRTDMATKRKLKDTLISKELNRGVKVYGSGDVTLVGWGSTKGAILESLELLRKKKINARFVQVRVINPFPVDEFVKNVTDKVIVVENNRDGQLVNVIKQNTQLDCEQVNKFNGRAFTPEEIAESVEVLLK